MPLICQLDDPVYRRPIYLFIGPRNEFREWLTASYGIGVANKVSKRNVGLSFHANTPHPTEGVTITTFFVWLLSWDGSPERWGALAHECYHAVCAVFGELGLRLDDEEAVAYYLDCMVTQFGQTLTESLLSQSVPSID